MQGLGFATEVFDGARRALIDHFEVVFGEVAHNAAALDDLRVDADDGDASGEGGGFGGWFGGRGGLLGGGRWRRSGGLGCGRELSEGGGEGQY